MINLKQGMKQSVSRETDQPQRKETYRDWQPEIPHRKNQVWSCSSNNEASTYQASSVHTELLVIFLVPYC